MSELRQQLIDAKAAMKCAWVVLGRLLNQVVCGGDYKEWGYDDFEVYCARELRLKKSAVRQLLVSYNYLKKHEAKRLHALEDGDTDQTGYLPDQETIALLDKVWNSEQVIDIEDWHRRAFAGEEEEAEFRKELRHAVRPATTAPRDPDRAEKAAVLGAARKLRKAMSSSHFVPEGLRERIETPLIELEGLDG